MSGPRQGTTGESLIRVERSDLVATVTFNRPQARNALNTDLLRALRSTMAELERDKDVRAVVLTGADPAFCAGLDLKELGTNDAMLEEVAPNGVPASNLWEPLSKPLIGAINGPALTGGLEVALNCDFLIASPLAVFADTHARVGLLPGGGMTVLLPQRVGLAMALKMSLTGEFIDAATALRAGLVTEVVEHSALLPRAKALAATMTGDNSAAVRALLAGYRRVQAAMAAVDGLAVESETWQAWRHNFAGPTAAERGAILQRGKGERDRLRAADVN
jgi:enoyl-CoA hydratase